MAMQDLLMENLVAMQDSSRSTRRNVLRMIENSLNHEPNGCGDALVGMMSAMVQQKVSDMIALKEMFIFERCNHSREIYEPLILIHHSTLRLCQALCIINEFSDVLERVNWTLAELEGFYNGLISEC